MTLVKWNNAYAVGHGQIDKQHKQIFDITNKLFDAIQNEYNLEIALELADEIIGHAAQHFSFEEKIMGASDYPDFENHRMEHMRVIELAENYREKMLDGNKSSALRMLNFLKDWILGHLAEWDRQYKPYINVKD